MDAAAGLVWPPVIARGGLCGAVLCSLPVGLAALLLGGTKGLAGWYLADLVVCAYFVTSLICDSLATRWMDARGLVMVLSGYVLRAIVIGVVLWQLVAHQVLTGEVLTRWFGWTTLSLVIGWLAGAVWSVSRTRTFTYNQPAGISEENQ